MKKRILSLFLIVIMSLCLCACGNDSSSSSDENGLPKVTLGTTSWPTNMFFYLAKEKGYFEENGVNVTIKDFSSTTESTNAFIGGKIDFCTFASSETISPFAQGGEFSIVLETDKSNGSEGLVAKSDIKNISDLAGKTIATQLYSVDHMLLLTLLNENGMTEKDVNIVDMSIQESGNAFIAGQCDAACIWDPYFSQAKAAGGTELFSSADNPNLITDVLGASKSVIKNNPDAVTGVIKAFFEAVDYWKENSDDANKIMGKQLGVTEEEFAEQMNGLLIPTVDDVVTAFTEADDYSYWGYTQNTVRDFMYKLGVFDNNNFDCKDMIDDSFVKSLAN